MLQSVGYERGVHLRGSPLWFDAERRRELCVLTGIDRRLPPLHKRIVASAPLATALQGAGYGSNILPTPWGRWMGLAGYKVQLVDGGGPPGAALALVERETDRVLVAGMLRARPVELPAADHLVVRLPALLHHGMSLRDSAIQVATAVEHSLQRGVRASVWVDSLEVGMALHEEMALLGQPLQPRALLAKLLAAPSAAACGPVASRPAPLSMGLGREGLDPGAIRVDSGLGLWPALPAAGLAVKVRWFADASALLAAVAASKVKKISVVGVPPSAASVLPVSKGVQLRFLSEQRQLALTEPPLL